MAMEAFDLAERFQSPGVRDERSRPGDEHLDVARPSSIRSGRSIAARCSTRETLARIGDWGRYKDVDGDGIPYRSIPGSNMPAYFTRGSGHNENGQYSERPDDYVNNMDRLLRKFETARQHVPRPEVVARRRAPRSASSATAPATGRSRRAARSSSGSSACAPATCGCARIRSPPSWTSSSIATQRIYVVEQNRDAQMLGLMRLDCAPERVARLRSVLHYSGLPIDARSVTDSIEEQEGLKERAPPRRAWSPRETA